MQHDDRKTPPLISVIVLSFARPALLERAITSIASQTYKRIELIVVDNPSQSSELIAATVQRFPSARLIANTSNVGFTGGMNRGIHEATGTYIYLTEDDIELDVRCIEKLVDYLEGHPHTSLAGPVMYNRHTRTVFCAGGGFELGAIYRLRFGYASPGESIPCMPFTTGFLPGSAIGARREVLEQLGGFRDDFFMYNEDIELCARVAKGRSQIAVIPEAMVFHHEPPSSDISELVWFHKCKNLAALYLLHAPYRVLPEFVLRYGLVALLRLLTGDRTRIPTFLSAWWWVVRNGPRLLSERSARVNACPTSTVAQ